MSDQVVIGKKYRILANAANHLWNVVSFWTDARDVDMGNGANLKDSFTALSNTTTTNTTNITNLVNGNNATIAGGAIWSPNKLYKAGDIVNYQGNLFYRNQDQTQTEQSWVASNWTAITPSTIIPFRFGVDANGRYGYKKAGADAVTPFSGSMQLIAMSPRPNNSTIPELGTDYIFTESYSAVIYAVYYFTHYSWARGGSWTHTLSASLGSRQLTSDPNCLLAGQLSYTVNELHLSAVTYALCYAEDVKNTEHLITNYNRNQIITPTEPEAYTTGVFRVLIGIE